MGKYAAIKFDAQGFAVTSSDIALQVHCWRNVGVEPEVPEPFVLRAPISQSQCKT